MNKVSKFYLKQAIYEVEIDGQGVELVMYYSDNRYEVRGEQIGRVEEIAQSLLSKKHGVNFAYKFADLGDSGNDKMEG